MHAWYIKSEAVEPLQLPQYFNTPIELSMSQWVATRKKWDGAIAKRASEGKSLTPASLKAYKAFLDQRYRKLVMNIKTKTHILELKMSLDPGHLPLRFGTGPFYHLYVRQFQLTAEEA